MNETGFYRIGRDGKMIPGSIGTISNRMAKDLINVEPYKGSPVNEKLIFTFGIENGLIPIDTDFEP